MSKGRIAVIPGCAHCPYKAIDSTMGIIQQDDGTWTSASSEICYCGYHLGKKETYSYEKRHHIRLEVYVPPIDGKYGDVMNDPNFGKTMPDDCPLPYGED